MATLPSGPSPEIAARLKQLRDELAMKAEMENRRQQAIYNMEKANGPVRLPTDKAKGGSAKGNQYKSVLETYNEGLRPEINDPPLQGFYPELMVNPRTLMYLARESALPMAGRSAAKNAPRPSAAIGTKVRDLEAERAAAESFAKTEWGKKTYEALRKEIEQEAKQKSIQEMKDALTRRSLFSSAATGAGTNVDSGNNSDADTKYSPFGDISYAKGGKIEVRPTVFDDAASRRNPNIEAAARALAEGKMKQKAYAKVVAKEKPVKKYDFIPKPATDEQAMNVLIDRQKQNWKSHNNWPAGHRVGLRLDIPAYERHGVWVNSIHDESGNKEKFPTSYGSVSSVRNATFEGSPHKAVRVATGEQTKTPFARIKGELEHIDEGQAVKHFQKYMNHPDYRQVGYDPRRHGDFYDRETMQPITHSEHVVQIGPLVLAKKPVYGKPTLYAHGGKVTHAHHLEIEERPL